MKSNRVYLAKTTFASGLDVQYVKSNLLRIPNVEVVGFGTGFKPHECACVVIVGDNVISDNNTIKLSPNVLAVLAQFPDVDSVFIYSGCIKTEDIENTSPVYNVVDFWEETQLVVHDGIRCLLTAVSHTIGARKDSWRQVPRLLTPKKKYALPPLPEVDDRRSHKIAKSHSKEAKKVNKEPEEKKRDSSIDRTVGKGTPLLSRRRR